MGAAPQSKQPVDVHTLRSLSNDLEEIVATIDRITVDMQKDKQDRLEIQFTGARASVDKLLAWSDKLVMEHRTQARERRSGGG